MDTKLYFILLLVVGSALAVPIGQRSWPPSSSHCKKSCHLNNLQKFQYQTGKTYEYELQSESLVKINHISGKESKITWSGLVQLHFDSPCEVTVNIKNPRVDGQGYPSFTKEITEYPLKATMSDGVFEDICVDPRDFTTAVNIKKGILSTLQNSLPSNSTTHSGIRVTETDVVGVCPTKYLVQHQGNKVVVEKTKEHRLCTERYSYGSMSPESAMFLKSPVPMRKSESKCTQEIEQGIVKSVVCVDKTDMTPSMGVRKYIIAEQRSTLKYKTETRTNSMPQLNQIRPTRLWYDFSVGARNESAIPDMERKLRELSQSVHDKMKVSHTAEIYSDLIKLMNQVPEKTIKETLEKVKSGQYGADKQGLEKLYLDAVGSTVNNGALDVMVEKILMKERMFEYTTSMFTIPRVCKHGLQYIKPLFEKDDLPLPTILAAGSIVGKYCKTEGSPYICESVPEVKEIMKTISDKLSRSVPQAKNDEQKTKKTIALLKAVGNVRRMTEELESTILSILDSSEAPQSVKVAAADALRTVPCKHEPTKKLLRIARESKQSTEVRIFSYKAGIECANSSDISELLEIITTESDSQVRSYILSHLTNLQRSTNPQKIEIRSKLAPFNITQTFSRNIWNSSLNKESSMFMESKLFGEELGLDIIYESAQMLPKEIRTNFTLELFKELSNVAEMGVRFENLPKILHKLFKEGSTLGESTIGKMIRDVAASSSRSSSRPGKMDYFLKLFGNEVFFSSLSTSENFEKEALVELYEAMGKVYFKLVSGETIERVKGYQLRYDLHIPTIQGIPLMVTADLSAVTTFQAKPSPTRSPMDTIVEVTPIVSGLFKTFVGYRFGPSAGLKINTKLTSVSDVKFTLKISDDSIFTKIDIPHETAELFKSKTESYLMVQKPGQAERKLEPSSKDPRMIGSKCEASRMFGLEICYEYNVSDMLSENDFPLVKPATLKVTLKKSTSAIRGIELVGRKTNEAVEIKLEVPGSQNPTKLTVDLRSNMKSHPRFISMITKTTEKTYGMKIVQDRRIAGSSTERVLEVFTGLKSYNEQGQKVLTSKLATERKRAALQVKTLGSWVEKMFVDVDVRGSLVDGRITKDEINLEKFEVVFRTKQYESENFIRKTVDSSSRHYSSDFNLKSHQSLVYSLKSQSSYKPSQSGVEVDSRITLTKRNAVYEGKVALKKLHGDNLVAIEVKEKQSTNALLSFVGLCKKNSQGRDASLTLEMPRSDISWKVTAGLSGRDKRNLELTVQDKKSVVLSVRGPLSYTWERNVKKINTQLGFRGSGDEVNYHVDTEFEMSPEMNKTEIKINGKNGLVLNYYHLLHLKDSEKSLHSKVKVPGKLDSDIELKLTQSQVHVKGDVKVPAISPRHLQGHITMDKRGREGHVSSKLAWDVGRNPEKQISVSGFVNMEEKEHKTMQGELTYGREKYNYYASYLFKHNGWSNIEKDLRVDVHHGTKEYISLRSTHKLALRSKHDFNVDSYLHLKTPTGKIYNLESVGAVSTSQSRMKIHSDMKMKTPGLGNMESEFSWNPRSSSEISVEGLLKRQSSSSQQLPLDIKYNGEVTLDSRKRLEKAVIKIDGTVSDKQVSLEASEDVTLGESKIVIKKNKVVELQLHSKRSGGSRVEVSLNSSDRHMKVTGRFDDQEKSIKIIPSINDMDKKIEMNYQHQPESSSRKFRVEYPHNGRQKRIESEWSERNQGGEGKIELDVMSRRGKLMTLFIKNDRFDSGVARYEIAMVSSSGSKGPELIVDTVFTRTEKSIVTSYKKEASAPISMILKTKYMKQHSRGGVVSVAFTSPQGKVDLGGNFYTIETYGTQGFAMNSTVEMAGSEPYVFEIMAARPAFIKMIAGRKQSAERERYVAKLGLESYTHAEISLVNNNRKPAPSQWKEMSGENTVHAEHPIFALSAKLISPVALALRSQYSEKNMEEFKLTIESQMDAARQRLEPFLRSVASKIANEVEAKIPEMRQAIISVKDVLKTIRDSESLQKVYSEVRNAMSNIVSVIDSVSRVFSTICKNMKSSYKSFMEAHSEIRQKVNDVTRYIVEKVKEVLKITSEPFNYNIIMSTFNSLKELATKYVSKECTLAGQRCQQIKTTVAQVVDQMRVDLVKAFRMLIQDRSVAYARSVVRRHVEMIARGEYFKLAQSAFVTLSPQNIGFLSHKSGLQVNLPLRQPLGSVLATPWYIGFNEGSFVFSFRTTEHKLVSFNGVEVELPKSKCQYYLTRQNRGVDMIMGNLKQTTYFHKIILQDSWVQYEPLNKKLVVNGKEYDINTNVVIRPGFLFRVVIRNQSVLIQNPLLSVQVNFVKHTAKMLTTAKGRGVAWEDLKGVSSESELLNRFQPHLVDPSCSP